MIRLRASLVGAAVLALALSTLLAPTASAHDSLVSSSPADQATVAQAPAEVVLTFDAPAIAMGTRLVVMGPDGEVQQGTPRLVDKTVTQSLASGAPAGAYTVEWRVTSADGHPVSGVLRFTATAAGTGTAGTPAEPPPTPTRPTGPGAWVWLLVVVAVVSTSLVAVRARRRRDLTGGSPDHSTPRTPTKENL